MKSESSYIFGLVGEKNTASLSPSLFTWAMAKTGIHGTYTIYDFPRRLARSLIVNANHSWVGLNVTSPYKDLAYEVSNLVTDRAAVVRSVNALTKTPEGIRGDNTDIAGFKFALQRRMAGREAPKSALFIGTGGAARACIYGCKELYPQIEIHIATRRTATAVDRLAALQDNAYQLSIFTLAKASRNLADYDLIVQASPVGHDSMPGYPLPPPLNFKHDALVMDLIYTPRKTLFLEAAEAFHSSIENGLVMLIAQGAECFRHWTGHEFPMNDALSELLPEFQKK
jgi:shikimate dehydrogenase